MRWPWRKEPTKPRGPVGLLREAEEILAAVAYVADLENFCSPLRASIVQQQLEDARARTEQAIELLERGHRP